MSSNAEAARRARDEEGTAAIAGETASDVYGLKLLATEIEDSDDNTTRFFVVGRKVFKPSGDDRTTMLCSALDTESPGALFRLLEPLAKHKISLTRIESRPSRRKKWDYVFFFDIDGHAEEAARRQGARRAQEACVAVPRARLVSARRFLIRTFLVSTSACYKEMRMSTVVAASASSRPRAILRPTAFAFISLISDASMPGMCAPP